MKTLPLKDLHYLLCLTIINLTPILSSIHWSLLSYPSASAFIISFLIIAPPTPSLISFSSSFGHPRPLVFFSSQFTPGTLPLLHVANEKYRIACQSFLPGCKKKFATPFRSSLLPSWLRPLLSMGSVTMQYSWRDRTVWVTSATTSCKWIDNKKKQFLEKQIITKCTLMMIWTNIYLRHLWYVQFSILRGYKPFISCISMLRE